jgi:hypothetical protein
LLVPILSCDLLLSAFDEDLSRSVVTVTILDEALAHGADLVVSNDRRLRREVNAPGRPLRAVTGDEFAQRLLVDQPDGTDSRPGLTLRVHAPPGG